MESTLFISFFHVPFGTKEIHQASLIKLRSDRGAFLTGDLLADPQREFASRNPVKKVPLIQVVGQKYQHTTGVVVYT